MTPTRTSARRRSATDAVLRLDAALREVRAARALLDAAGFPADHPVIDCVRRSDSELVIAVTVAEQSARRVP